MPRGFRRAHRGAPLVALALLSACGDCGKKSDPEASSSERQPAVPRHAVLEGTVRLAEGFELPQYDRGQLEKRVLAHTEQAPLPEACPPPKTTDGQPVQITADGFLTHIALVVTEFDKQPQRPPRVHEVVIEDCRLEPRLVVAQTGDQLRVRNTADYPFMPAYGPEPVVKTLIRGQTYDVTLDKPGVSPLLCGFTAPCGRTDVIVLHHPVYAVSGSDGRFKIENVPPGEDLKLTAWHPLFEESAIDVRVEPGEVKRVELVIKPLGRPVSPEGAGASNLGGGGSEKA
jgi:hypothetical protein